MTLKLLFSIVKVNFRKNWIMILSFLVFLIVSLSLLFGMVSFTVGFHNQLPEQVLQDQNYSVWFRTTYNSWDDQPNESINGYKPEMQQKFIDEYITILNKQGISIKEDDNLRNLIKNLVTDFPSGDTSDFINNYLTNTSDKQKEIFKNQMMEVRDWLLDYWGNSNLVSFTLYNDVFTNKDIYNDATIWNGLKFGSNSNGDGSSKDFFMFPKLKSNEYNKTTQSLLSQSQYTKNIYEHQDNIFYTSPSDKSNYVIGQQYVLQANGLKEEQKFTYAGTMSTPYTFFKLRQPNSSYVFINNYVPEVNEKGQKIDFRLEPVYQWDVFSIIPNQSLGSKQDVLNWFQNIANDKWLNVANNQFAFGIEDYFYTMHIFYYGVLSLTIMIAVIMLILDIVVAWFLIKEMTRSLSQQLLFLKTIGVSNWKVNRISALSLIIILGCSLGLSLVGMLGIQALFINLINSFIDDYSLWSSIEPFSLIVIFGAVLFLFIVYYISGVSSIKKLALTIPKPVYKGEMRFPKIRNWLFTKNVNSGITFSFAIKNLHKMVTTLIIALFIMTLSFTVLEFKISVDNHKQDVSNLIYHQDTLSWLNVTSRKEDKHIQSVGDYNYDDGKVSKTVNYVNGNMNKDDEISYDELNKLFMDQLIGTKQEDITDKYVTRKTLDKFFDNELFKEYPVLLQPFKNFEKTYDFLVEQRYPNYDRNFSINFGSIYRNDAIGQTSYNMQVPISSSINNDSDVLWNRLIVMQPNDPLYNKVFRDAKSTVSLDNNNRVIVPIVVGKQYLNKANLNIGDESSNKAELNIPYSFTNDDKNDSSSKKDQQAFFTVKYDSTYQGINDGSTAYIKQSDFEALLNNLKNSPYAKQNAIYSFMLNQIKTNDSINSFYSSGVPITLKQLVLKNIDNGSLGDYLDYAMNYFLPTMKNGNISNYSEIKFLALENKVLFDIFNPIITTMLVVLALTIVLMISFLVFTTITIMNENDDVVFIMKALGYKKSYILWKMISGYLISIPISIIVGIILSVVCLHILNGTLGDILNVGFAFFGTGSIVGLIIGLFVLMSIVIVGLGQYKIRTRNLTSMDSE